MLSSVVSVHILRTIILVIINITFDDLTIKFIIFGCKNTQIYTKPNVSQIYQRKMTLMINKPVSGICVHLFYAHIFDEKGVCHMFISAKCITN